MPTSKRLRSDDISGGGTPTPLVTGESFAHSPTRANMGTADVRYNAQRTISLTPLGQGAGDTFKLVAYDHGIGGDFDGTATAALAYDVSAANMQTALRTATGDTTLTVACPTPATDPWVVTYVGKRGQPELVAKTVVGAGGIQVTREALTYDDVPKTGTAGTVPSTNGIMFDQESSKGLGLDVPLGYSIDTRGTGQTRGGELKPPVIDSITASSGQVIVASTADASDGTDGVALVSIRKLELAAGSYQWVHSATDADGDVTITGHTADADYVLVVHALTQADDATTGGQVSRGSAPVYFTAGA